MFICLDTVEVHIGNRDRTHPTVTPAVTSARDLPQPRHDFHSDLTTHTPASATFKALSAEERSQYLAYVQRRENIAKSQKLTAKYLETARASYRGFSRTCNLCWQGMRTIMKISWASFISFSPNVRMAHCGREMILRYTKS